ncbi:unnamed protein product [marine sediment metagenome]|uniref:Uncharacterized protein n=1 Tax=marine sediment metagenome TaxID=412755 RepID=X0V0G3_9ZZZZ
MRIEFSAFLRRRSNSNTYYLVVPSDYIRTWEHVKGELPVNQQVRVEVEL